MARVQTDLSNDMASVETAGATRDYLSVFGHEASNSKEEPKEVTEAKKTKAPLTIFYKGSANIYSDIPEDVAKAVMFLANKLFLQKSSVPGGSVCPKEAAGTAKLGSEESTELKAVGSTANVEKTPLPPTSAEENKDAKPRVIHTTIPPGNVVPCGNQARRASLRRFLDKRRERTNSVAPYSLEEGKSGSDYQGEASASGSGSSSRDEEYSTMPNGIKKTRCL